MRMPCRIGCVPDVEEAKETLLVSLSLLAERKLVGILKETTQHGDSSAQEARQTLWPHSPSAQAASQEIERANVEKIRYWST